MKCLMEIDAFHPTKGHRYHTTQLSKSFVRQLAWMLYARMYGTDITTYDTTIYSGYRTNVYGNKYGNILGLQPNMYSEYSMSELHRSDLGIRLGSSDQAVTPIDVRLITPIPDSCGTPEVSEVLKLAYDHKWIAQATHDNYNGHWIGQTLYVPEPVQVTKFAFKVYRDATLTAYTSTIAIRATYNDVTNVVGGDLATATYRSGTDLNSMTTSPDGEFFEYTFPTPYTLLTGQQYAFLYYHTGPNVNEIKALYSGESSGSPNYYGLFQDSYSRGVTSTDWTNWSGLGGGLYPSFAFKLWGKHALGLSKQGTKIYSVTTSGSTAQFIIEDYFTNYCGSSVTVKEVALYGLINDNTYEGTRKLTQCLSRDTLGAPVTVLPGEIMRVRYIPQVTV